VKQITLHAEAEEELRQSEQFYAERGGDGLALDFVERVRAALRLAWRPIVRAGCDGPEQRMSGEGPPKKAEG